MITALFETAIDDEYGTLGFRMRNRPHFNAVPGMAVAHDLLEHFPGDDGTLEHELMALGASLFVRNFEEYFHYIGQRITDPVQNIASDFINQYHLHGEDYTLRAINTRAFAGSELYIEDVIQSIFSQGRRVVSADTSCIPEWLKSGRRADCVGWLRHGYRSARRRYRRYRQHNVLSAFMEIEKLVDGALRTAEPGEVYRVTAEPARGGARVTLLSAEVW